MPPILLALIAMIGACLIQDGLASIAFYPNERLKWNHMARLIRALMGLVLVVIGLWYLI